MTAEDYIKKQIRDHHIFVNGFTKLPMSMIPRYTAPSGKRVSIHTMHRMIEKDLGSRVDRIAKKLNYDPNSKTIMDF